MLQSADFVRQKIQTTDSLFMVRPTHFAWNPETAATNRFAHYSEESETNRHQALAEFTVFVENLRRHGITVHVLESSSPIPTPDAVFPNNWISTHATGELVLYPMSTISRRAEQCPQMVEKVAQIAGTHRQIDLASIVPSEKYLEGTGSLVLDRVHKIAYAGYSSRTHPEGIAAFCAETGYRSIGFEMADLAGREIYHTNVMMSVGTRLAVVCLDAISDPKRRTSIKHELNKTDRQVIEISISQLEKFCGNLLELHSESGEPIWAMSESARQGFNSQQLAQLQKDGKIVSAPLPTIEKIGGGSARCMMAEIFKREVPNR